MCLLRIGPGASFTFYFLGDGIYPEGAIFIGPSHGPLTEKDSYMTEMQGATRKDIERLFGCLQGRFRILRTESFNWRAKDIVEVSEVCVIMHNMLVELRIRGGLDAEMDNGGKGMPELDVVIEFIELSASEVASASSGFIATHVSEWNMNTVADLIIGANAVITNKDSHFVLSPH